jgi:hypothetical protein
MDHPQHESENPYASPAIPTSAEPTSPSRNTPGQPLVEPIRIAGALSIDDYLYAIRLSRRKRRIFMLFAIPLGIFMIDLGLYSDELANGKFSTFFTIFFLTLIGTVVLASILKWLIFLRIKKSCVIGKGPFAQTKTVISEDSYVSEQELMAGNICWSAFRKFCHSDRLAVLFLDGSPNTIVIFPRKKFQTQHDWECFLGLLERKLPRG